MASLSLTHTVDADAIAYAMGGFDRSDVERFVRDLIDGLQQQDEELAAQFINAVLAHGEGALA
ncbi:MAG TPA: hypothetical protein VM915_15250 [Verrucomicrobiae bacterium]|nr:hypothetical protein [Verrucomicrobiae bacterium]